MYENTIKGQAVRTAVAIVTVVVLIVGFFAYLHGLSVRVSQLEGVTARVEAVEGRVSKTEAQLGGDTGEWTFKKVLDALLAANSGR